VTSFYGGPNAHALQAWIAEHMPALDAELGPMVLGQVRLRLNAETGLSIRDIDSIEESCALYLAALKEAHR
jgi:hypothetical protein